MTITNTILRNDYTGNGVATVFNFTFIVLNETGGYTIQVITTNLSGIETIKTQNVDYTVQLNDNGLGTITFTTAPLLNHKITLLSNVPNTQETDYIKAGTDKFPAESHEKALDKLTLICKQFTEKFNRIVSLPKNSNLNNIEFPISPNNSNQVITINNDGTNLTTRDLADVGLAPVSSYIKTLLDDINSSQARATLEAQQLNNNLTALASLIGSSNKIPYFTGEGVMALTDIVSPASTITQGIIQIATNAEVLAGIVANKAIAPSTFASLFGNSSRSSAGYIRIPVKVSGAFVEIIIQWGSYTPTPFQITFPITFPNSVFQILVSFKDSNYGAAFGTGHISTANWSQSGFYHQVGSDNSVGGTRTYIAIGH